MVRVCQVLFKFQILFANKGSLWRLNESKYTNVRWRFVECVLFNPLLFKLSLVSSGSTNALKKMWNGMMNWSIDVRQYSIELIFIIHASEMVFLDRCYWTEFVAVDIWIEIINVCAHSSLSFDQNIQNKTTYICMEFLGSVQIYNSFSNHNFCGLLIISSMSCWFRWNCAW